MTASDVVTLRVGAGELKIPAEDAARAYLEKFMLFDLEPSIPAHLAETPHPPIGSDMPGLGGLYAGILRGDDGAPDYRLFMPANQEALELPWGKALKHADGFEYAGHKDYSLPTRRELRLLYINLKEHFEDAWYWSSEQLAGDSDFAWMQNFGNGNQGIGLKSNGCRVRLVRRVPIR